MATSTDPQQRVGRATVALVVAILAAALLVQVLKTQRGPGAQAAVEAAPAAAAAAGTPSAAPQGASADATPQPAEEPTGLAEVDGEEPVYTFVSAPDLLNADIGDVRTLPTWRDGMANSTNKTVEDSLGRLYRDMASWDPDAVLVAGDEVRGHWDQDGSDQQIFGPVGTDDEKRAAITRAAQFYYPAWKERFGAHGIDLDTVYPAIGDHEIGDNPWPAGSFELSAVPQFKQLWADAFTTVDGGPHRFAEHPTGTAYDDTAYATYLTDDLLLVSVDTFAWSAEELRIDVDAPQLAWLEQVLADAPDDATILVQGHVPVLTPVRLRGSSSLHLDYGGASQFWQLLKKYGVDLYLNGEVHSFTATQLEDREPIQVSHGGLFAHGTTSYLVGRVFADGSITLDARTMPDQSGPADRVPRLWQTRNNLQWKVRFPDRSRSVGTMRIDGDNHVTDRSGLLAPFTPGVGAVLKSREDGE